MGYRLNRLDEHVFMAVSKPLLTEFGIYHRMESCVYALSPLNQHFALAVRSSRKADVSSIFIARPQMVLLASSASIVVQW